MRPLFCASTCSLIAGCLFTVRRAAGTEGRRSGLRCRESAATLARSPQSGPEPEFCRVPDLPAIEDIGRHVHDSFFRAMLADPARANGVIRAHWPRQLRWLLEGAPAKPVDSTLVRDDLRQFRMDTLFLVGGEGSRPNAMFVPEHKFGAVAGLPGGFAIMRAGCWTGLTSSIRCGSCQWSSTPGGDGGWNVLGAIDETSDDPRKILVQMRRDSAYFARQTRRIRYGNLSCEAVSHARLGMMGLAGRRPYPRQLAGADVAQGCRGSRGRSAFAAGLR